MPAYKSIVILTGAGISAESGVDTFRDKDGIWSKVDYRDVATPEGFVRDAARVHDFYNQRRRGMKGVRPNAAHTALARLEREFSGAFLLVTQNIDDLHERAGSASLVHMHGELGKALCQACEQSSPWEKDMSVLSQCPACGSIGYLRPDVVWFGEMPYQMERIGTALAQCDLFVSIGTSGNVYPAAGFVGEARFSGARTVELNLEPSDGHSSFDEAILGKATEIVPAFVERLLSGR
ncbi:MULTISPECIES: NAD-dependent deacylase [Phyllobacteriaceae]|jgi:NAD-dependent deacetylase|uniref:NAD-dependent protein deacylase n=1 Tax=Mesorhizobium hungaricum TaxID=1566387 RepID=A0A1C2DJC8_9HYPH|nr:MULTISPECIES: NAD-dependent deacylase [Mesorhizobium]MBN9233286.1 NAD-dependent deacylase [Mesorhizobium sp.]MDQ0332025.1 NAD-dependent deacetylase [Mesorhizobium sp. YL-MeA3-2017]OCX14879.1 NAD-dependent protein deacylase [Mesorhizobium hungaricum]